MLNHEKQVRPAPHSLKSLAVHSKALTKSFHVLGLIHTKHSLYTARRQQVPVFCPYSFRMHVNRLDHFHLYTLKSVEMRPKAVTFSELTLANPGPRFSN